MYFRGFFTCFCKNHRSQQIISVLWRFIRFLKCESRVFEDSIDSHKCLWIISYCFMCNLFHTCDNSWRAVTGWNLHESKTELWFFTGTKENPQVLMDSSQVLERIKIRLVLAVTSLIIYLSAWSTTIALSPTQPWATLPANLPRSRPYPFRIVHRNPKSNTNLP